MLWENRERGPQKIDLELEYARAYEKAPGRNSVSFQPPRAPVSRWRVVVDEPGVRIDIRPFIAASAPPDEKQDRRTVLMAFVGAADTVRMDWTPRAEGATGLAALATVQVQQQVTIDEGVVRTRGRLQYDISRAALSQLALDVPEDQKVVNVFDQNVRQWSVAPAPNGQRITVQLFEPARRQQRLVVELERFEDRAAGRASSVPMIRADAVSRQQGIVVIDVAPALRAEPVARTGLFQVDAGKLPPDLARKKWAFAYQYAAPPYELAFRVEKIRPRIVADMLVEARLRPQRLEMTLRAIYEIRRAGVFSLNLDVPDGYELRQVRGYEAADMNVKAVAVGSHHRDGADRKTLEVNLSRQATGRVGLALDLHRRLAEPDLLKATGRAIELDLDLPRASEGSVARQSGRLVIHAPESLRVDAPRIDGARTVSFEKAMQGMPQRVGGEGLRPVIALAYADAAPELALTAERRRPHVAAAQVLVVRIDSGVMKSEAAFDFDVRYSPVRSVRVDVPEQVSAELRNQSKGLRDRVIEPPPADLPEGYRAWSFRGDTELMGKFQVVLGWEKKIGKLDAGRDVALQVPRLRPANVDRAWGQIVLAKSETIDVRPAELDGMRPIDPRHDLIGGRAVDGAASAFEFQDDWTMSITATRYELQQVKTTSIERALVRMVATRSRKIMVQALYRVRSASQRVALRLPIDAEFDTGPLRINGQNVTLERGAEGEYFVPLVGQSPDEALLIELRYRLDGGGSRMALPVFPSDPAVQKVYLSVYLPRERALLGTGGPWTHELRWALRPIMRFEPVAVRTEDDLRRWVAEGVDDRALPNQDFQVDGRRYLFSALRPTSDDTAALTLTSFSDRWLHLLVFACLFAIGVALLRRGAAARWMAIGALVAALVLLGVFMPTLSRQLIDGSLCLAVFVVAVLWIVHHQAWVRPRDPAVRELAEARRAARLSRLAALAGPTPQPAGPPPDPAAGGEDEAEEGGRTDA
ncbi:MAG: hypothetical protein CMJ18_06440 [Phycisphaeraceae bacterium]|nr:hypothetical protein [Phycisphaeraceae bacterium]